MSQWRTQAEIDAEWGEIAADLNWARAHLRPGFRVPDTPRPGREAAPQRRAEAAPQRRAEIGRPTALHPGHLMTRGDAGSPMTAADLAEQRRAYRQLCQANGWPVPDFARG